MEPFIRDYPNNRLLLASGEQVSRASPGHRAVRLDGSPVSDVEHREISDRDRAADLAALLAEPISWSSPALPRALAIRCWARAAGTAGAYVPEALEDLADDPRDLPALLGAAAVVALDRHDAAPGGGCYGGYPRGPSWAGDTLVWDTSVAVTLRVCGFVDGAELWRVEIHGEHSERQRAAEYALAPPADHPVDDTGWVITSRVVLGASGTPITIYNMQERQ